MARDIHPTSIALDRKRPDLPMSGRLVSAVEPEQQIELPEYDEIKLYPMSLRNAEEAAGGFG
jgi:hypothetical protein